MGNPKVEKETLGERIRKVRGEESVAVFTKRMGIHRNTLPRWENGERQPGADFLEKLCTHYAVDPNWLLLGKEKDTEDCPGDWELANLLMEVSFILKTVQSGLEAEAGEATNETSSTMLWGYAFTLRSVAKEIEAAYNERKARVQP